MFLSWHDLIRASFPAVSKSELSWDVKLNKWLIDIAADSQIAQDAFRI